jgi:hypothetical protein
MDHNAKRPRSEALKAVERNIALIRQPARDAIREHNQRRWQIERQAPSEASLTGEAALIPFVCECGTCLEPIELTHEEFNERRITAATSYTVAPGHAAASAVAVERHARFWIVVIPPEADSRDSNSSRPGSSDGDEPCGSRAAPPRLPILTLIISIG